MARGSLLAFEGIDASGKSTQARRVAAARDALFTFEPGDSELGAELRQWVLDAARPMTPATTALLMLADRAHHVATVIEPALAAGRSVVSDRYAASTLAYQGYGAGLDLDALRAASRLACGGCVPVLTILLDVPVSVARARRPPSGADRFEAAGEAFAEAVRRGFLELAAAGAEQWLVVDGTADPSDVAAVIDARLDALGWPAGG
jgi:dTMP kinase